MISPKIALIIGYGPRVGASVATRLASSGYLIAVASRSTETGHTNEGYLSIKADTTVLSSIPLVFATVRSILKSSPSVVIYNAGAITPAPDISSVLSVPVESFVNDINTNTVSAYLAAQESIKGFESIDDKNGVFIYTGNCLNVMVPTDHFHITLGVGKSASAHWIATADGMFKARGYRFYYADQRKADGRPAGENIDGDAHGEFYLQLVQDHTQGIPWHATFMKHRGYAKF